jgi:adenylosuccinate synthase
MLPHRQAIIVADLGFGDSGKGTIVDYLVRRHAAHTVVRFNGGGQAAHNVITPDGRHHTFAQFGSGTFCPRVRTYLSRFMLVDPLGLLREERHLREVGVRDALPRLAIDRRALVVTPLHQAMNRLRELARGAGRHGSCGQGIGETMADALADPDQALRAGDLADPATVRRKVRLLRERKLAAWADLRAATRDDEIVRREAALLGDPALVELCAELYGDFAARVAITDDDHLRHLLDQPGSVIFEGAQGVLLDEWYGFHPYTTWSTTTFANAEALVREAAYGEAVTRLGVLRAYATRHGAGPFVTEDASLTAAIPDRHNTTNPWQRAFRVGHLDLVAARYAVAVTGPVDALAVTNLDRLDALAGWHACHAYRYGGDTRDLAGSFAHSGATIHDIAVQRPPDLARQADLTERLLRCAPIYTPIRPGSEPANLDRDRAALIALLETHLGAPVVISSSGPSARDKTVHDRSLVTASGVSDRHGRRWERPARRGDPLVPDAVHAGD